MLLCIRCTSTTAILLYNKMEVRYSVLFSVLTFPFSRSCSSFFGKKKKEILFLMLITNDNRSSRRTRGGAPWWCSDSLQTPTRCDRNRSFLPKTRSHALCHLVTVTKILQNSWEAAQLIRKIGHICLSQRIWFLSAEGTRFAQTNICFHQWRRDQRFKSGARRFPVVPQSEASSLFDRQHHRSLLQEAEAKCLPVSKHQGAGSSLTSSGYKPVPPCRP